MKKILTIMICACLCITLFAVIPALCGDTAVTVPIQISPNVVNLDSEGIWLTVHVETPYNLVAGLTITLNGIPVDYTKSDNRGDLVAKFDIDQVKEILEAPNAELWLYGSYNDGSPFEGTGTIGVVEVRGGK